MKIFAPWLPAVTVFCTPLVVRSQPPVAAEAAAPSPLGPSAVAVTPDGRTAFVACELAGTVQRVDLGAGAVTATWKLSDAPSGVALSPDGRQLAVTLAAPRSTLAVLDAETGAVGRSISCGYGAMEPVWSPDGSTVFLCERFDNRVAILPVAGEGSVRHVPVPREPAALAVTPDGRRLIVANHLPHGRADADHVAAVVNLIDVADGRITHELRLPNGSTLLRGVAVSPDGRHAAVTHLLGRFHLPTTQLDRGWVYTNALTLIDLDRSEIANTVLLDSIDRGAANPWAVDWSSDGTRLAVTHAGTHELSVIDAPGLLGKLARVPAAPDPGSTVYIAATRSAVDVPNDLSFLVDLRHRVALAGKGPRGLAVAGATAVAAHHFSDSLSVADLNAPSAPVRTVALGPPVPPSPVRLGELHWNDATLCFQGWLSCSSCHSSDARVDGLNWDNLNDGIGNPKNAKSLILSFQTPPTTALGVRANAHVSVRSGIRHILFTVQPDHVAEELDAYLSSLKPMPSPFLAEGRPSPAAERGKALFLSDRTGCSDCHRPPLYTNLKAYDVGTHSRFDKPEDRFDTPTLVELWRSGPYLHDGSAVTVRDIFTSRNPKQRHGLAHTLSPEELDDLAAFLLSL
jgi:DNA-binding beta-propeller fold protein YncE